MARAAAKRTPRPRTEHHGRQRRPGGGGGVEQTLFFQRIRRQAKWVFVFLAVVFAGSFVVFGVGSGSTGIGDLLRGNFGGIFGGGSSSGSPSIDKAQKAIAKNPKNAQAYRDLASAYEKQNDDEGAIGALERYVELKPKDVGAMRELAAEYDSRAQAEYSDYQAAQFDEQAAQPSNFGPAPNTPLGKALTSQPSPITEAVGTAANVRVNDARQRLQETLSAQEQLYAKIVKLDPADPQALLQYAQSAQSSLDVAAARAAYQKFLKLFPDDPSVPYAKQQLKTLAAAVSPPSGG
jgi:Flp pilus assembly protein TadD